MRYAAAILVAALALGTASCEPARGSLVETIEAFSTAVQEERWADLFCLSAGAESAESLGEDRRARREAFVEFALGQLAAYERDRDQGRIQLDGHGIQAVKLFALLNGTFFDAVAVRDRDGRATVRTRLRFGYAWLDLSRLTPGTTLYLAGRPAGRVISVRVPAFGGTRSADVLEELELDWTLVRREATADCGNRWAVAAVEPVAGSESVAEVSWSF